MLENGLTKHVQQISHQLAAEKVRRCDIGEHENTSQRSLRTNAIQMDMVTSVVAEYDILD